MNPVSRIAPVSDADAARMVSPRTTADLAERIMATPAPTAAASGRAASGRSASGHGTPEPGHGVPPRGPRHVRRWAGGLAAAAALAVAALVVSSLGHPGQKLGPVSVGPPKAEAAALSFTRDAGYIDVVVRNPVADPKIYAAEFAAHHLRITLKMVPVSPSLVGTVIYVGTSGGATGIGTITARGRCWTGGAGSACPVGLRVPLGFHGTADFAFGRAARPGEQYESTGLVTSRGEVMHGLAYRGKTVPAVLAMLRARQVTVAQYRYMYATGVPCGKSPHHVPGSWRVYSADPWAPHQVMLWVGPPAGTHIPGCPTRIGTPSPNPTPSASPSPSASGSLTGR
jgi:hypothetical protein